MSARPAVRKLVLCTALLAGVGLSAVFIAATDIPTAHVGYQLSAHTDDPSWCLARTIGDYCDQ
jgi:hypothetical protein